MNKVMETSNELKEYYNLIDAGKIIRKTKQTILLNYQWVAETKQELPDDLISLLPKLYVVNNVKCIKKEDVCKLEQFFELKNTKYKGISAYWVDMFYKNGKQYTVHTNKKLPKKEIDKLKDIL